MGDPPPGHIRRTQPPLRGPTPLFASRSGPESCPRAIGRMLGLATDASAEIGRLSERLDAVQLNTAANLPGSVSVQVDKRAGPFRAGQADAALEVPSRNIYFSLLRACERSPHKTTTSAIKSRSAKASLPRIALNIAARAPPALTTSKAVRHCTAARRRSRCLTGNGRSRRSSGLFGRAALWPARLRSLLISARTPPDNREKQHTPNDWHSHD